MRLWLELPDGKISRLNSKGAFRVPPDGRVVMEAPGSGRNARRRNATRRGSPTIWRMAMSALKPRAAITGAAFRRNSRRNHWRRFAAGAISAITERVQPFWEAAMAVADSGGISFLDALHGRVDDIARRLHALRQMRRGMPDGRAGRDRSGAGEANAPAIVGGMLDLLAGGPGTPEAERWAQVCTNSGKCIPACDYGVNPRFMVNMARIAAKAKLGEDAEVRRAAQQYFTTMGRSTRVISRLQLPPEVLARISPPLRAADEYTETPDIVFYTGCNVIKTPHIALLVLEVLDALGVTYEVMGGTATCCGIQQFKRGDAKTAGRVSLQHDRAAGAARARRGSSPGARAARSRSARSRCRPIRNRSARCRSTSTRSPSSSPSGSTICAPLFVHPVSKRVALQERAALPDVMAAVKQVLGAIPGTGSGRARRAGGQHPGEPPLGAAEVQGRTARARVRAPPPRPG